MALVAASRFVGDESSSEINAERSEALRIAVPLGKPSDTQIIRNVGNNGSRLMLHTACDAA